VASARISGRVSTTPVSRSHTSDESKNSHIHARLEIVIGGQCLPRLGFWGPDDVCLNTWVRELLCIRSVLGATDGRYVFDEGEQGQPAFAFERCEDRVLVSVLRSKISDAGGDDNWHKVPCRASELFSDPGIVDELEDQVLAQGWGSRSGIAVLFTRAPSYYERLRTSQSSGFEAAHVSSN
jgi:hypothetical protein